ncbi:MAG: metallophosphoesterase [Lachnospiraceae bacterium]|jgi:putative phosphoesterase|nr:metallophosphoesterase [Lachnospiraceae bacterium]
MKIFIISDTHGDNSKIKKIGTLYGTPDALIHAGDFDGTEQYYENYIGCPTFMVAGNNDFSRSLPKELVFTLCGHTFFLTHGHRYSVRYGDEDAVEAARENGADILVYGHTHVPEIRQDGGILVLNPGSLTFPRQRGFRPTFIILNIDDRTKDLHPYLIDL